MWLYIWLQQYCHVCKWSFECNMQLLANYTHEDFKKCFPLAHGTCVAYIISRRHENNLSVLGAKLSQQRQLTQACNDKHVKIGEAYTSLNKN